MTFILSATAKQSIKNNSEMIEILWNMTEEETFEMFEAFLEFSKIDFEMVDKYILTKLNGKVVADKYYDDSSVAIREYELFICRKERGRINGYYISNYTNPSKYTRWRLLKSLNIYLLLPYKDIMEHITGNIQIKYEDVEYRRQEKQRLFNEKMKMKMKNA